MMTILEIGCCGAYCKTCRASETGSVCRGCKLGYADGERDINRARCRIKLCCFRNRGLETCSDCVDYPACDVIRGFQDKSGTKYKKYRQALDFIRAHGYPEFIRVAEDWHGPYGKLP